MEMSSIVAGEVLSVPNSAGTAPPQPALPAGATDCHFHIFDPRFPTESGKPVTADATVDHYRLMMRRLGLSRGVVIAPTTYKQSNDCLLDALEQFGDIARGVAIVPSDVSLEEIKRLHAGGVRGARFYFNKNVRPADETIAVAHRVADLGWHLEFVATPSDQLIANEAMLRDLPCRVVIDHFGHIPQPEGVNHPAAAVLMRLLEQGNTWIKLSATYRSSKMGFPDYEDLDELASKLIATRGDRILWGTDWPHTGHTPPDPAKLLERIGKWTSSAEARHRILVDNPTGLYWS